MIDFASILARKLNALFPQERHRRRAEATLNSYGTQPHEQEALRVRLAVIKLSGDDLEKIEHNTTRAKQDDRDVLAWAESPRQSK